MGPSEKSFVPREPEHAGRTDIFISYAREDQPFVRLLHDALAHRGRRPWVDWEGIPPTAEWLREVKAAIESADSFIFVVSPDSVASRVCREEAEHAVATGKRIIPLLRRDVDDQDVPEAVAARNWIFFRDQDDFESSVDALIRAQDTDLDWLRGHTRLLVRAGEWDEGGRDRSLVLRGKDLDSAERWLGEAGNHADPRPTPLHTEFILASRRASVRGQRWRLAALSVVVIVSLGLSVVAFTQQRRAEEQARLARSREIAATSLEQLERDPHLSLILAIEAYEAAPTAQAEAALRRALVSSHLRRVLPVGGPYADEFFFDVSPDGTLIATGAPEGAVALWDLASGKRLAVLEDPGGRAGEGAGPEAGPPIVSASFSPNGNLLFSGHGDGPGRIWSVPDGRLVTRLEGAGFSAGGWTPDGRFVLTPGVEGARLWDVATGAVRAEFRGGSGPQPGFPGAAVLSPDGEFVAIEDRESVRVVRVSTGRTVGVFDGSLFGPAAFSPDGRRLLTRVDDSTVRVFDVASRRAIRVLRPGSGVYHATFSPDGTRVLTGHIVGSRIWEVRSGEGVELSGHAGAVVSASFSPDGELALTVSEDGTARVWNARTGRALAVLAGHEGIGFATFTPDGRFAVTAGGSDVGIWEMGGGALAVLRGHHSPVVSARFSPHGRSIISGDVGGGTVRVWDVATRREESVLRPPTLPGEELLLFAEFSADGRVAVTSGLRLGQPGASDEPPEQEPARLWDLAAGTVRTELDPPQEDPLGICPPVEGCAILDAALSPDGTRVATVGLDGLLHIWDAGTGTVLETIELKAEAAVDPSLTAGEGVEWTPDGRRLVTLTGSGVSYLFDAATLRKIHEFGPGQGPAVPGPLGGPKLGPGGSLLAVGYPDGTARVWETATERLVAEFPHAGPVHDLAFSPDGSFLVTASGDAATIWDLESQRPLGRLFGHQAAVLTVDFSPDGSSIVSGSEDETVRIWRCEVCAPIDEVVRLARSRVLRELTPGERARFLP